MKKLLLLMVCMITLLSCNEKEKQQPKQEVKEVKKVETENLEGIYQGIGGGGRSIIRIRKSNEQDLYLVEFGRLNENEFLTLEGFYSHFSIKDYPNIDFSCPTGRIIESFQDSNTLELYKLKVKKRGGELYLSGKMYQADFSKIPPTLLPARDTSEDIFKRISLLPEDLSLKFFNVKPELKPVNVNISEISNTGIICNKYKLLYGAKITFKELKKQIGNYKDFEEYVGRIIVYYPNLELHFNNAMEFVGIGKDIDSSQSLNIFGYNFSLNTSIKEIDQLVEEKSYKAEKEEFEDDTYYKFFTNEEIKVQLNFYTTKKYLQKIFIIKEEK